MTSIARKAAAAFVAARPCHTLTLAHVFLLLWAVVAVYFAAQYLGTVLWPGLVGEWNDPTISETPWSWSA